MTLLGAPTRFLRQMVASTRCVNSVRQHVWCVNSVHQLGASTRCVNSLHQLCASTRCVNLVRQLGAEGRRLWFALCRSPFDLCSGGPSRPDPSDLPNAWIAEAREEYIFIYISNFNIANSYFHIRFFRRLAQSAVASVCCISAYLPVSHGPCAGAATRQVVELSQPT